MFNLGRADCGKRLQLLFSECQERSGGWRGFVNSDISAYRRRSGDANPPEFVVKTVLWRRSEAPS